MEEVVQEYFEENFRSRGELGAGLSVWKNGEEILSLAGGFCEKDRMRKWESDTLVPVYSATKGPAAATLMQVLARKGMDETTLVAEVWPEFPNGGATFGQMLSH